MPNKDYENRVLQWREEDTRGLMKENGWLALAGLFPLHNGINTVGSDPSCDVVLPARAPKSLGTFEFDGETVRLRVADQNQVEVNGQWVSESVLRSNKEADTSFIVFDGMRMVIHIHSGTHNIRIWDNQRPERLIRPHREWFPIQEKYHLPAKYVRYDEPQRSMLPNVFDGLEAWMMTGYVSFELDGSTYTLDVTEQKSGKLFVQFKDLTSRENTYPPGRYIYTEPIDGDQTIIDFNYCYNPPCVFTEFATCAFAPKQNHLPIKIEAGEKYLSKE